MNELSDSQIEESTVETLDFNKLKSFDGSEAVLPVVLQHADDLSVLFVAYVNREALNKTLHLKRAVLYSTSRRQLWYKGESSGDILDLVDVRVNCEQNSLLFLVRPRNQGVCHSRNEKGQTRAGCFYRRVVIEDAQQLAQHTESQQGGEEKAAERLDGDGYIDGFERLKYVHLSDLE